MDNEITIKVYPRCGGLPNRSINLICLEFQGITNNEIIALQRRLDVNSNIYADYKMDCIVRTDQALPPLVEGLQSLGQTLIPTREVVFTDKDGKPFDISTLPQVFAEFLAANPSPPPPPSPRR